MARSSLPAVRSSYMKNLFAALENRGLLAGVERHDGELIREVEGAWSTSWIPVELNVRAVEAVVHLVGETRGLDTLGECVHAQFETPLWRNFIGGGVRLLGRDPASLGRWIPDALALIFRNCGVWAIEARGENALVLIGREIPEPLARHRLWLRSLGLGMKPLFLLCGVDGTSDLVESRSDEQYASYRLSWKPSD